MSEGKKKDQRDDKDSPSGFGTGGYAAGAAQGYNYSVRFSYGNSSLDATGSQEGKESTDPHYYYDLADEWCGKGDFKKGIEFFQKVMALDPQNSSAMTDMGVAWGQGLGNVDQAMACFRKAIEIEPGNYIAWFNLGNFELRLRNGPHALECYKQAFSRHPKYQQDLDELLAAEEIGSLPVEAQIQFFQNIIVKATEVDLGAAAHFYLAERYRVEGDFAQAVSHYQAAIAKEGRYFDAILHLANVLAGMDDVEGAMRYYDALVELQPDNYLSYGAQGKLHSMRGNPDKAIEFYGKALARNPNVPTIVHNLALAQLKRLDFQTGWRNYEARLDEARAEKRLPSFFVAPGWRGEALNGKTIGIVHEQGIGDTLQFVRYLPLIISRQGAGRVFFDCPAPLRRLLEENAATLKCTVVDFKDAGKRSQCDEYAMLLSLPGIFQTDTGNVPFTGGYLSANRDLAESWQRKMDRAGGGEFKVGIVWTLGTAHPTEESIFTRRSAGLDDFSVLFDLPRVKFYSLQVAEKKEELKRYPRIIDLGSEFSDFADTAAAIENLDLIISIDTSVPHLAAALGKPTWLVLPFSAEWRWGACGARSYWYDTMRIFREPEAGNWGAVFREVREKLLELSK